MSENRQEHSEELTELQEAVEMATLDKEMAEERVIINDLLINNIHEKITQFWLAEKGAQNV